MTEDDFRAFFRAMHPRLKRYASRVLDGDAADQAAVDALHVVWNRASAQPVSPALESLAFRAVDGLIRNELRGRARQSRLVERLGRAEPAQMALVSDISTRLPDSDTPVANALRRLRRSEQTLLLLVVDGYRVGEIATIQGLTPAAVTMRLQRAKQHLRQVIDEGES